MFTTEWVTELSKSVTVTVTVTVTETVTERMQFNTMAFDDFMEPVKDKLSINFEECKDVLLIKLVIRNFKKIYGGNGFR